MPTLFERPLNRYEHLTHSFLKRALEEFQTNTAAPRIMRGLARDQPWLYYVAAMHLLKSEPYSLGRRYLSVLLLSNPDVIVKLTDPREFTRKDIAFIFKTFMETDRLIDVKLARHLPGRYGEMHTLDLDASARMLDILDQISPGRRLIPILGYLTQHPDSTIAAKAALLVARRIRNPDWVRRHVGVKDARVRANVVEGLWGSDAPYALPTYQQCVGDENNRVVGNALMGMHLLGEDSAQRRIVRMSEDQRIAFRWTAAWVLGQAAKPENVQHLQRMIKDDSPNVRSAALKGLFAIRRVVGPKAEPVVQQVIEEQPEVMELEEVNPAANNRSISLMLDGTSFRYRE